MIRTHKIEILPNQKTQSVLDSYFGYSRHCFNRGLDLWKQEYLKGNKPNGRSIRNMIKGSPIAWYTEYSPQVLDTAIEDLDRAFQNFFAKRANYPKFKSKRKSRDSARWYRKSDSSIRIKNNKLYLPKFKYGINLTEPLRFKGTIKTCTITKQAGRYFASFTVELDQPITQKSTIGKIGIDLGLKTFATCVDHTGKVIQYNLPKKLNTLTYRLKVLQRHLARKKHGSNKWSELKIKIQKVYMQITNIRKDFLHKLTTNITNQYQKIGIEKLNVRGMIKFKNISRSIHQSCFYTFRLMLEDKSNLYGNNLVVASPVFPSTQKCSACGNIKKGLQKLKLSQRVYSCVCGHIQDRDQNAATNLRDI